jgi:hypothetical protein
VVISFFGTICCTNPGLQAQDDDDDDDDDDENSDRPVLPSGKAPHINKATTVLNTAKIWS